MPRYDKYDPYDGGFRAPLNAAVSAANKNVLYAVSLNSAGRVVVGTTGGQTGIVGVMVAHRELAVGQIVDVMTDGEIVELTGLAAGTVYYAQADGTVTATASSDRVGHTVEAGRLIVRFQKVGA